MRAAFVRRLGLIEIRLGQAMEISMGVLKKIVFAAAMGLSAVAVSAASAADGRRGGYHDDRDRHRPAHCDHDHDHRAHDVNYYDYYPADRYYRAGPYRASGLSVSVNVGGGYDRDRYDRYDRYDGPRRGRQIVKSQTFDTRYRASIYLVEEVYYNPHGRDRLCTVSVRGPQAHRVPDGQVRSVAHRYCSRGATIRVYA